VRSAEGQSTYLSCKRRTPNPERAALSAVLFGLGLALLVLSIGGSPGSLHPQLVASFAIISLAVGFRVAGGPPVTSERDPR